MIHKHQQSTTAKCQSLPSGCDGLELVQLTLSAAAVGNLPTALQPAVRSCSHQKTLPAQRITSMALKSSNSSIMDQELSCHSQLLAPYQHTSSMQRPDGQFPGYLGSQIAFSRIVQTHMADSAGPEEPCCCYVQCWCWVWCTTAAAAALAVAAAAYQQRCGCHNR